MPERYGCGCFHDPDGTPVVVCRPAQELVAALRECEQRQDDAAGVMVIDELALHFVQAAEAVHA